MKQLLFTSMCIAYSCAALSSPTTDAVIEKDIAAMQTKCLLPYFDSPETLDASLTLDLCMSTLKMSHKGAFIIQCAVLNTVGRINALYSTISPALKAKICASTARICADRINLVEQASEERATLKKQHLKGIIKDLEKEYRELCRHQARQRHAFNMNRKAVIAELSKEVAAEVTCNHSHTQNIEEIFCKTVSELPVPIELLVVEQ